MKKLFVGLAVVAVAALALALSSGTVTLGQQAQEGGAGPGSCTDGIDNDVDGLIDGDDPDCFIAFRGFSHQPLGQATLTLQNDTLVVGNIGSSGDDGVAMGLGVAGAWAAAWEFPNFPEGAFVKETAVGQIEGVPNQIATTAKMQNTGSGLAFSANFAPLGSPTLTANFFLGGNLVETIPGVLNDQIAWTIPPVVGLEVPPPPDATFKMRPDGGCAWDWEPELAIAIQTILGDIVVVDRVVLVEEPAPGALETDFFTAIQITGTVGSIVITDVSVTSPVGGTVELLGQSQSPGDASGSSARDYTVPIAAAIAAGAVVLAAAGWHAKRRWMR